MFSLPFSCLLLKDWNKKNIVIPKWVMFSSIARVHVPAEMLRLNRRQRNNSLEYFLNEIFSLTKLSSLFAGCRLTKCPFNSCKTLEEVKLLEDFRPTWNYEKLKFDPRYIKQSFAIHCPGQLYNLAKKNIFDSQNSNFESKMCILFFLQNIYNNSCIKCNNITFYFHSICLLYKCTLLYS